MSRSHNITQRKSRSLHGIEQLSSRLLLAGDLEFRSFDGSGNNELNEDWGAANTALLRLTTVAYGSGMAGDFPSLAPRLDAAGNTINPRTVSNALFDQDQSVLNDRGLTSFNFQWGQFIDHDMDLTEDFLPVGEATMDGEFIPFFVTDPTDELPLGTMIPMLRSRFELDADGVAQQINQITSYIDASNVYGSDAGKASGLRAHVGGFLLTSDGVSNLADGSGEFLPLNTLGLENAAPPTTGTGVPLAPESLFVAGDVRSNEQPGLTSLHTLFVREHNYQARQIADRLHIPPSALAHPLVDEYVYQLARAITNAEVQSITYNEFLPSVLGPDQLASYDAYRSDVQASIANVFSASLYRFGHSMLPNELLVLNEDGTPVPDDPDVLGASVENGEVNLGEAFFNPELVTQFGIEAYLKGLATQQVQEVDHLVVDGVRNLLFDPPAGTDLGATNLQRGRDHGLADYNQIRVDYGLDPLASISEISERPEVVAGLAAAYDAANDGVNGYEAINNIDVFAGALSEDHIAGGSVGELLHTVLVDQFTRLRDGDRFYYENVFSGTLLDQLQNTRLSEIIRRNTNLQNVQDEVFRGANVFTYRAPEGFLAANISLRVRGDELQIVRGSSNRVLASQALADTSIVVIYGTSRNDNIRIDKSVADAYRGSVELHGGGGGNDRLLVQGAHRADHVQVTPTSIAIDDLSLYYGNFERVRVPGGHGGFHLEPQEVGWVVGAAVAGGRGWDNAGLTGQGRLAHSRSTLSQAAGASDLADNGQAAASLAAAAKVVNGLQAGETTHALRQDGVVRRDEDGTSVEPSLIDQVFGVWGSGHA